MLNSAQIFQLYKISRNILHSYFFFKFFMLFVLSLILFDFSIRLFRERRDRMKREEMAFIVQIAFRSRRNIRTNSITWRSRVTRSRRAARGEVWCTIEINFFTYIPDNILRYIEIQRQHAADEATKSTRRVRRRDIQRDIQRRGAQDEEVGVNRYIDTGHFFLPINS